MQNQHPASFLTLSPQTLILNSEVSHVLHVQSISNAWKLFLYIQKLLTANSGFSSPCILTTAISFLINYFSLWWAPVMIIQNMDRGLIMFACPFNQMESSPRYLHPKFISLLKKKLIWEVFLIPFWLVIFIAYQHLSSDIQLCNLQLAPITEQFLFQTRIYALTQVSPRWEQLPIYHFPCCFEVSHSLALRKPELRFIKVKSNSLFLIGIEWLTFKLVI